MADPQAQTIEYQWAYSIMDSSRVSTFLISMLLIVYGSFRSLNMEQEARDRANGSTNCLLNPSQQVQTENNVQTLDTMQALCLPLGASISLLVMFFFFDSMQMLFAICTAIIATVALAFLLLPMCQYIIRPCSDGNKISFGMCGRFTAAELLSFSLSVFIVCIWVLTGELSW
jgi:signal peptide peptidase-like protein 3